MPKLPKFPSILFGELGYHYAVMGISWTHNPSKWSLLKDWAMTRRDFWWNHMSGSMEIFAFYSIPRELKEFCDGHGISFDNFKIYVDWHFEPDSR